MPTTRAPPPNPAPAPNETASDVSARACQGVSRGAEEGKNGELIPTQRGALAGSTGGGLRLAAARGGVGKKASKGRPARRGDVDDFVDLLLMGHKQ
jgi:hypothetical protein